MTPIYDPNARLLSVEEMIEIESSVSFTPVDDTETIRFLYGQMDSLSKIGIALGERVRVLTQERDVARIERDNWRWAAKRLAGFLVAAVVGLIGRWM